MVNEIAKGILAGLVLAVIYGAWLGAKLIYTRTRERLFPSRELTPEEQQLVRDIVERHRHRS